MTGPEKMRRAESLATVLRGSQQSAGCVNCNPDDARLTTLLDRLLFLTEPLSAGCGVYDSDDVIDTIKRNEAFFSSWQSDNVRQ